MHIYGDIVIIILTFSIATVAGISIVNLKRLSNLILLSFDICFITFIVLLSTATLQSVSSLVVLRWRE